MPLLWTIFGLATLILAIRWKESRLLYRRDRLQRAHPEDLGLRAEDVPFVAEDGVALHGWWFEHPEALGTLLVCHGNAGNIGDRLWIPRDLQDLPINIFLFDYRGYGQSRGFPSETGTRRDVLAAYEVVRARHGQGETPPVVVFGRSLGGAVALQLAVERPVKAVILESAFTSVVEIGERFYPWLFARWTCRNRYPSLERIPRLRCPVLVAHSPDDEIVPYDMGQRLFSAAPEPKRWVQLNGLHEEAGWQTCAVYAKAVRTLIREVLPARPPSHEAQD